MIIKNLIPSILFISLLSFTACSSNKVNELPPPSKYAPQLSKMFFGSKAMNRKPASEDTGTTPVEANDNDNSYVETTFNGIWVLHDILCPQGSEVVKDMKPFLDNPESFFQLYLSNENAAIRAKFPKDGIDLINLCNYEGRFKIKIDGDNIFPVGDAGLFRKCPDEEEEKLSRSVSNKPDKIKIREKDGHNELHLTDKHNGSTICTKDKKGSLVFRLFIGG